MTAGKPKSFSVSARIKSFGHAIRGILLLLRHEHNAWLHLLAMAVAIALGCWLRISAAEWCIVILCIGLVLAAEAVNTSIEYLTDLVSPGHHEKAGKVKDLAAGAVLLLSIAAAICGLIIFIPRLIDKF